MTDHFQALLQPFPECFPDNNNYNPLYFSLQICAMLSIAAFIISTVSNNMSQVDKLWSITPCIYAWLAVCDSRTLLMAVLATLWGARLTWNFYRRGGYSFPPWKGEEDYRWSFIREGAVHPILKRGWAWTVFNLAFISVYQNLLLFLLASPSHVSWISYHSRCFATGASPPPLNVMGLDCVATMLFLAFLAVETVADNQQWAFQSEKCRRKHAGDGGSAVDEFSDGFCQSGLFCLARKPNYAAEQALWISYYLFSIAARNGVVWNWSASGCILLCFLFQGSAWLTEKISISRYPKYQEYKKKVPLFIPTISSFWFYFHIDKHEKKAC